MTQYQGTYDDSQGSPNLGALQYTQEEWGPSEIAVATGVSKVTITASGTAGVEADIPLGVEIIDICCRPTTNSGGGTAKVRVGGAGADISNAMTFAVNDTMARAGTIDTTYARVGGDGIEVVTHADADQGIVYIIYRK